MKKTIALSGIALLIFSLVPFASAETASANASADAQAVSVTSLKFKKLGESFGDFVFSLKAAFTFSQEAKLELLKKRNEDLKSRQKGWLELKANILGQFGNINMSAEQKQELLAEIQAEHKEIIQDHLTATAEIRQIQLSAKADGKADVEAKAEAAAEVAENSGLSLGLNLPLGLDLGLTGKAKAKAGASVSAEENTETELTAEEAAIIVKQQFGFKSGEVRTETKNGVKFYVVTGHDMEVEGSYALTKDFEVWINSETGIVTSVNVDTSIEARTSINSEISSDADASIGINARGSVSSKSGSDADAEAKTKASVKVGIN